MEPASDAFLSFNTILTVLIAFVGTTANIAVLILFARNSKLRNVNHMCIAFLSISDLIRASLIMPTKAYSYISENDLPTSYCTFVAIISGVTFVYTPLLLAMIAVVRYVRTMDSLKQNKALSKRKISYLALIFLGFSIFFACLPLIGVGRFKYSKYHGLCFPDWSPQNRVYRAIFYTITVGFAFPVLVVAYIQIFRAIHDFENTFRLDVMQNFETSFTDVERKRSHSAPMCNSVLSQHGWSQASSVRSRKNGSFKTKISTEVVMDTGKDPDNAFCGRPRSKSCQSVLTVTVNEKPKVSRSKSDMNSPTPVLVNEVRMLYLPQHHDDRSTYSTGDFTNSESYMTNKNQSLTEVCPNVEENIHAKACMEELGVDPLQESARVPTIRWSSNHEVCVISGPSSEIDDCFPAHMRRRWSFVSLSKREMRLTKTMFFLVLAYIICWIPAAIVNIVGLINQENVPEVWYYLIVTLVELKSAVDPIIYGMGNRRYKYLLKFICTKDEA